MKIILLILSVAFGCGAFAQSSPFTVDTIADLLRLKPNRDRPEVHVLGGSSKNDGGGGDYVWMEASTEATNTITSPTGGPIAWPYGGAVGRWVKRIIGKPVLGSATLSGQTRLNSGDAITAAAGSVIIADQILISKTPFTETSPAALVPKGYVDYASVVIVQNLAALKALDISLTRRRLAVVLSDTGSDGASGDWYWEPDSLATTTPVCVVSDLSGTGRWFKR